MDPSDLDNGHSEYYYLTRVFFVIVAFGVSPSPMDPMGPNGVQQGLMFYESLFIATPRVGVPCPKRDPSSAPRPTSSLAQSHYVPHKNNHPFAAQSCAYLVKRTWT